MPLFSRIQECLPRCARIFEESEQGDLLPGCSLSVVTLFFLVSFASAKSGMFCAKTRLARPKQALKNIDDPDFGLCRECGEEIALKRLKAMPESELCIDCAE
jgi:hypothetical protein